MKYLITLMLVLAPLLHAEYKKVPFSNELITQKVPIVDIRTAPEWEETGVVKGTIAITFFSELGQYDIPAFLKELNAKVDTSKEFALICRTGSRTGMVGMFLSDELKYKVIDIQGGIMDAYKLKAPIVPYQGK
jgi:rhodanese-related sulfurtransferase